MRLRKTVSYRFFFVLGLYYPCILYFHKRIILEKIDITQSASYPLLHFLRKVREEKYANLLSEGSLVTDDIRRNRSSVKCVLHCLHRLNSDISDSMYDPDL